MKWRNIKQHPELSTFFSYLPTALAVFVFGLILTALLVYITYDTIRQNLKQEVEFASRELQVKFEARLRAHAQILRSGAALFAVSDTVTRLEWNRFYVNSRISTHYPGIQGFGYTKVIPADKLDEHINMMRSNGFPRYKITPETPRDYYTSIIYLEPFTGRNLRAFGFDMYSEPVRRRAMQAAADYNLGAMSGKVTLVQETDEDVQPGFLVYVPVYQKEMPLRTVEERRAAIKGWVYSPFRMHDLTQGILQQWALMGLPNLRYQIYDGDVISEENLMFDSHPQAAKSRNSLSFTGVYPVIFNNNSWTLVTTSEAARIWGDSSLHFVFFSGLTISILLFLLTAQLKQARIRSNEIQMLNVQLQKVNSDKDRFISILGHDLKNPFNNILGLADILATEELQKEESDEYLKMLNDVARRTYKLLEELLEWARVQTGSFPFRPDHFPLEQAVEDALGHVRVSAMAKNITIRHNTNGQQVYADYSMLRTILRNLISNAVKFTRQGGVVTITAEEIAGGVKVNVADNGIGMDEEKRQKLFGISEIITTKGTADEKGTGLGLILCKEFVDVHKGSIWVESEEDKGSTFSFIMPNDEKPVLEAENRRKGL
jgi:signal transduction histidine kinase